LSSLCRNNRQNNPEQHPCIICFSIPLHPTCPPGFPPPLVQKCQVCLLPFGAVGGPPVRNPKCGHVYCAACGPALLASRLKRCVFCRAPLQRPLAPVSPAELSALAVAAGVAGADDAGAETLGPGLTPEGGGGVGGGVPVVSTVPFASTPAVREVVHCHRCLHRVDVKGPPQYQCTKCGGVHSALRLPSLSPAALASTQGTPAHRLVLGLPIGREEAGVVRALSPRQFSTRLWQLSDRLGRLRAAPATPPLEAVCALLERKCVGS
jgi:hypothetical protein